jgi:hypothetical protein
VRRAFYGTESFMTTLKIIQNQLWPIQMVICFQVAHYLWNATKYIVANKRADHIIHLGLDATIVDLIDLWEKLEQRFTKSMLRSLQTKF